MDARLQILENILQELREESKDKGNRPLSLAITKLEECITWYKEQPKE